MLIKINHEELIRDYAGYEFIQDEMESAIQLFLQLSIQDILRLYGDQSSCSVTELQVYAAGAGTSKFVFGISVMDERQTWTFGIRLYQNKGKDNHQVYDCADAYRADLEKYDRKLVETIVDEIKIYREFKTRAKTGLDIKGVWTQFPVGQGIRYVENIQCPFFYIEDYELKRLLANLGINAITVGDFIIGYDGQKILERREFTLEYQLYAIVQMCNTLLQTWLSTTRYGDQQQIVGRSIVDLNPSQFIVQMEGKKDEQLMPAVIIDVGPAENTDPIYTDFKNVDYMKELVPVFARQMLKKLALPEVDHQPMKQYICQEILNYLEHCKQQTKRGSKKLPPEEFTQLLEEFILFARTRLLS